MATVDEGWRIRGNGKCFIEKWTLKNRLEYKRLPLILCLKLPQIQHDNARQIFKLPLVFSPLYRDQNDRVCERSANILYS